MTKRNKAYTNGNAPAARSHADIEADAAAAQAEHDELDTSDDGEAEASVSLPRSVVQPGYKQRYIDRAEALQRKPKGVSMKALKRMTGDWLAIELAKLTLDEKSKLIVPQFDARIVLAALERFEVTTALMTSTMLPRLTSLASSEGKPKHRLRRLMYGGTTLSLPELQAAMNLFGPVLIQIYGRLEAGWPITLLDQADHEAIARGETHLAKSCGRAVGPPVEFALRAPAPPGDLPKGDLTQTEVCTRSELTIDGFADSDGWCRTGDLAEVDEAGYVYLGGRPDGMINTGYHIYPAEIEKVIRSVDGVADVLVRGEARPTYGHAIVAYIVADDSRSTDDLPNVVTGTLEAKLARHKRPHRLMLVKELPR